LILFQYAVVFKTPAFRDVCLQQPAEVYMQLQRNSDLEGSDPIQFTYQPEDPGRGLESVELKLYMQHLLANY